MRQSGPVPGGPHPHPHEHLPTCPTHTSMERRVLFGEEPSHEWNGPTVRRMCRRSELKAARWLDADVQVWAGRRKGRGVGF